MFFIISTVCDHDLYEYGMAASKVYTVSFYPIFKQKKREMRERANSNLKTLFYKDCSLALVKNLSNN